MPLQLFRLRRGKVVLIPENRRGQFPTNKTIHDRGIKARCKKLERRKRLIKEKNDHMSSYMYDIEADMLN